MTHDELFPIMQQATQEVFATMLATDLTMGKARVDQAAPGPREGVVSLVGLAGSWIGTGMICSTAEAACAMSGLMLMQDYLAVDEEVLDAVGELTNMIFGNVKTELEEKLGPMGLSIPTVIYGRNFNTRSVGNKDWTVVPFTWPGHAFEVHLCLTLAQHEAPRHSHGLANV